MKKCFIVAFITICMLLSLCIILPPEHAKASDIPTYKLTMNTGEERVISNSWDYNILSTTWETSSSNFVIVSGFSSRSCKVKALNSGTGTLIFKCWYRQPTLVWDDYWEQMRPGFVDMLYVAFYEITIKQTATSVSLPNQKSAIVGDKFSLIAQVAPSGVTTALTWSSSNEKIATVADGVVNTLATGTTDITVRTSNGLTATCKVAVAELPTPVLDKAVSQQYNTIVFTWKSVSQADGYTIFRKQGQEDWGKLASVNKDTLAYKDETAVCGQTCFYTVAAYRNIDSSKTNSKCNANGVSAIARPATPEVCDPFVKDGSTNIYLKWGNIAGAEIYNIYRSELQNGSYMKISATTALEYTDATVEKGKTYYYRVSACKQAGKVNIQSLKSKPKQVKAEVVIIQGKAVSAGYNSIQVSWDKATGAGGYLILRATEKNGKYTSVERLTGNGSVTCTDQKLNSGTTYWYKIRAFTKSNAGNIYGSYSKPVSATTSLGGSSISAESRSYDSILLTWEKTAGATGYEVFRSESKTGTFTKIGTFTARTYTDKGLELKKYYYYKVKPLRNADGKLMYGALSDVAYARPEPGTPSLDVSETDKQGVIIKWSKVTGATGYVVYRATSDGGSYEKVKVLTSELPRTYTETGIPMGVRYYYKVRAFVKLNDVNNYGNYSDVKSGMGIPQRPDTINAKSTGSKSVKISWWNVPGSKGANIYQATDPDGPYTRVYYAPYTRSSPLEDDHIYSCTLSNLDPGKKYYYLMKAYIIVNGSVVEGIASSVCDVVPQPNAVVDLFVNYSNNSGNQYCMIIHIRADEKCEGYEIYRAEGESSDFIQVGTLKDERSTTSSYIGYYDPVTSNDITKYKYMIRPYITWQGNKVFGPYSKIVQWTYAMDSTSTVTKDSANIIVEAAPLSITSVTADKTSTNVNTAITWTAAATGDSGTKSYRFKLYKNGTEIVGGTYGSASTYKYTPTETGTYKVRVYVKDSTGTVTKDSADVVVSKPLSITSVSADKTSANAGTAIIWTAAATGGNGTKACRFLLYKDGTELTSSKYTTSATYKYTPTAAGTYRVRAYVKDSTGEVSLKSADVTVKAPLSITSVTADKTSAAVGAAITWTAKTSGGSGPKAYRFKLYKDDIVLVGGTYGPASTYQYTPTETGIYKVRVYVKDSAVTVTKDSKNVTVE